MGLTVGLVAPLNDAAVSTSLQQYVDNILSGLVDLQTHSDLPAIDVLVFARSDTTEWLSPSVREEIRLVDFEGAQSLETRAEQFGLDVVHILIPRYMATNRPTLFSPFDLRHCEFPEQFDSNELAQRRRHYPRGCERATVVDTLSVAMKDAVVEEYGVDPEKVQPVPLGPALVPKPIPDGLAAEVRAEYDLPESFALYPANTWPHKNHERLVEALEHVVEAHGKRVPLVCTGARDTPTVPEEYRVGAVPEGEQVLDLGFVPADHLRALYRECRLLVYPTLYEGGGLPVLEAWQFDAPVVCSDIPPLREKGGDAAAYFDPTSVEDIGDTLYEMWTNARLREELVECGRARREQFTWRRTARIYHALYRKAAGRELSAADEDALAYPDDGV